MVKKVYTYLDKRGSYNIVAEGRAGAAPPHYHTQSRVLAFNNNDKIYQQVDYRLSIHTYCDLITLSTNETKVGQPNLIPPFLDPSSVWMLIINGPNPAATGKVREVGSHPVTDKKEFVQVVEQ